MGVTINQVIRQIAKVNSGESIDGAFLKMRRMQKEFVSGLVAAEGKVIQTTPAILRRLCHKDFPDGTLVRVRKYRVNCHEEKWAIAWHVETFRDLRPKEMPNYLKDFMGV